jgi:hypothetical protein
LKEWIELELRRLDRYDIGPFHMKTLTVSPYANGPSFKPIHSHIPPASINRRRMLCQASWSLNSRLRLHGIGRFSGTEITATFATVIAAGPGISVGIKKHGVVAAFLVSELWQLSLYP